MLIYDLNNCPTLEEIRYVFRRERVDGREIKKEMAHEKDVASRTQTLPLAPGEFEALREETLWTMAVNKTLPEAASSLGVSCTRLKVLCRKKGIERWPRRKAVSLESIIESPRVTEVERDYARELLDHSLLHRFAFTDQTERVLNRIRRKIYKGRYVAKSK